MIKNFHAWSALFSAALGGIAAGIVAHDPSVGIFTSGSIFLALHTIAIAVRRPTVETKSEEEKPRNIRT